MNEDQSVSPALIQELERIAHSGEKDYSPIGITGDPDTPYRDWRGTPLEIGATVVYGTAGYTGGVTMTEGIVVAIKDKPLKKNCTNEWRFTISVEITNAAGKMAAWKQQQVKAGERDGKPKRQGVVAVERVTVVF